MKKLSAKNKIFILLAIWACLSAFMFFYLFGKLDASNKVVLDNLTKKEKDLLVLEAERESYKQAQFDLQKLTQQPIQPDDFFSKDITLVKEIKVLENLSQKMGVKVVISGITGTVNSVPKAKTITPILTVPYSLNVTGDLATVTDFVETLENLSFITNVTNISISSVDNSQVNANLNANFYIKK